MSPSAVAKTIKHYDETGSHEDRPRKGRPRVTSAAEDKFIRVTSLRNHKLTAPQIRAQIDATQSSSRRHISTSTVQRRLSKSGLLCQIAAKKTLLFGPRNTRNVHWTSWSLCFGLFFINAVQDTRFWSVCDAEKVNGWSLHAWFPLWSGGGGVMVWGCFAGDTVGDLFKIEGTLNQHGYHSILQWHAIPSGLRLLGLSFNFQQDNDPKHTSRLCKSFFTKKKSDRVLRQMTLSPQSPDLNPIEMVLDEMDHRVKAKGPTSAQHLWELLQDCWKTISDEYLLKIIGRMPRVCKALIKAKGGYFEES